MMKQILENAADQFFVFGISQPPDGYGIVKNDMVNTCRTMPNSFGWPTPGPSPEQFFKAFSPSSVAPAILRGASPAGPPSLSYDGFDAMLDAKTETTDTLRTPDWYKSATRWTQLTLVEDDPDKFDPAFWIDIFKRTQSNATCLSAGGYIAYYPSKVPLHYVSK